MTSVEFYRAFDADGRTNSVAAWADHRLYLWVPNTKAWHRNKSLEVDFLTDRELRYEEVGASDVPAIIEAAKPADERVAGWVIDRYRAQPEADRRTSAELGLKVRRQRATKQHGLAERLMTSRSWVAVKVYDTSERRAAVSLASDLRKGLRKSLQAVGPLETRVEQRGDQLVVEARRVRQRHRSLRSTGKPRHALAGGKSATFLGDTGAAYPAAAKARKSRSNP